MPWLLSLLLACGSAPPEPVALPPPPPAPAPAPEPAAPEVQVHLTIDDLPWQIERRQTHALSAAAVRHWNDRLLATLRKHDVRASGFVNCGRLQDGDEVILRWRRDGHAIGNHSHSHLHAKQVGPEAFLADVARCQEVLRATSDVPPVGFRYPYLGYGEDEADQKAIAQGLARLGLRNVPVTVPTSEWVFATRFRDALADGDEPLQESIVAAWLTYMDEALDAAVALSDATEDRGIVQTVLVHDNELSALHLGRLIDRWQARGVLFVDVDAALADPVFTEPVRRTSPGALPWVARVRPDAPDALAGWFGREEAKVLEAWPIEAPGDQWHRGVAPVPRDIEELRGWLREEGFVGDVHGAPWPKLGQSVAPPPDPGVGSRVARLVDATKVTDGFHHAYDLRCAEVSLATMEALAAWTRDPGGQGKPAVAFPLMHGACVATVMTEPQRFLLDELLVGAGAR